MSALPRPVTPGPWHTEGEPLDCEPGWAVLGGGVPGSQHEGLVAVAVRPGGHEDDEANAHAIAALPDLWAERDRFRAALVVITTLGGPNSIQRARKLAFDALKVTR